MMTMQYQNGFPSFFNQAPTLTLFDPLAKFLGAAQDGLLTYTYADAVKLAGHSCPTVAGSYLMVIRGLTALYGDAIPERGGVEVLMSRDREDGTVGVTAAIATLLTGAATEMGFAGVGIAKRFARRNLLNFNHDSDAVMTLRRKDNQQAVELSLNLDEVAPWPAEIRELLPRAFNNQLNADELARFADLWQARVRKILVDDVDDPRLILMKTL